MLPGLHVTVILFSGLFAVGSGDEVGTDLCRLPDGNFPYPEDCASFVRCQSGIPEVEPCPDGLLFNPFRSTCDFSVTGNCSNSDDFNSTSASVQTSDIACTDDSPNVIPITSSCSEYYLCENGIAFRVECPSGLLMNGDKMTCDYEQDVECDITSSGEESSVGITAIYESKGEESDVEATNEPEISGETLDISSDITADSEQTDTSLLSTEAVARTKESSSESTDSSEASTTIDQLITKVTAEESTIKQDSTTADATKFTVNKQSTVVTQTKENTDNSFTENTSTPTVRSTVISESTTETTSADIATISDQATSSDTTNTYPDLTSPDDVVTVETKSSEESEHVNNSKSTVSVTDAETQSSITETGTSGTTLSKFSLPSQSTVDDRETSNTESTTKTSDAEFLSKTTADIETVYQSSPATEKETFTDVTNYETSSENYLTSESGASKFTDEMETSEVSNRESEAQSVLTSEVSMFSVISTDGTTELENVPITRTKVSSDITATDFTAGSTGTFQEISSLPDQNITETTIDSSDAENTEVTTEKTKVVETSETPNDTTGSSTSITTLETEITESIGNDTTTITAITESSSNLSILPDDQENIDTTTKETFTTRIQTDSKMTPDEVRSTTQALMSSDPSTENDTGEFTTTTYYITTEAEERLSSVISTTPDLSTGMTIDDSSFETEIIERITTQNIPTVENQTKAIETSSQEPAIEDSSTLKFTTEISTTNHEDFLTNDSLTGFSTATSEDTPESLSINDLSTSTTASDYTTSQIDEFSTSTVSSQNVFQSSSLQDISTEPETTIEGETSSKSSSLGTTATVNDINKTDVEPTSTTDFSSTKTTLAIKTDITEQEIVTKYHSSESTSSTATNLLSDGTSELADIDSATTLSSTDVSTLTHTNEILEQETSSANYDPSTRLISTTSEGSSEFSTTDSTVSTIVVPSNDGKDTSEESTIASLQTTISEETENTRSSSQAPLPEASTTYSTTDFSTDTDISERTSEALELSSFTDIETNDAEDSTSESTSDFKPTNIGPENATLSTKTTDYENNSESTSRTDTNLISDSTSEVISTDTTTISSEDATTVAHTNETPEQETSSLTHDLSTQLVTTTSEGSSEFSTTESTVSTTVVPFNDGKDTSEKSTFTSHLITEPKTEISTAARTTEKSTENIRTTFSVPTKLTDVTEDFPKTEVDELTRSSELPIDENSSTIAPAITSLQTSISEEMETTRSSNQSPSPEASTSYSSTDFSTDIHISERTSETLELSSFTDIEANDGEDSTSESTSEFKPTNIGPENATLSTKTTDYENNSESTSRTDTNLISDSSSEVISIDTTTISSEDATTVAHTNEIPDQETSSLTYDQSTHLVTTTSERSSEFSTTESAVSTTIVPSNDGKDISQESTFTSNLITELKTEISTAASTTEKGTEDVRTIFSVPTKLTDVTEDFYKTEVNELTRSSEIPIDESSSTTAKVITSLETTISEEMETTRSSSQSPSPKAFTTFSTTDFSTDTDISESTSETFELSSFTYIGTSEEESTSETASEFKPTNISPEDETASSKTTEFETISESINPEGTTNLPDRTSDSDALGSTAESSISTESSSSPETTKGTEETSVHTEVTNEIASNDVTELDITESTSNRAITEAEVSEISVTSTSPNFEISSLSSLKTVMTSTPTDLETTQSTENVTRGTNVSTLSYNATSVSSNADFDPISLKSTTADTTFEEISQTTEMKISTTDISNGISDSDLRTMAEPLIPTRFTLGPETAETSADTDVTSVTPSNQNLTELYSTESTLSSTFKESEVSEISVTEISSISSKFEVSSESTLEIDETSIPITGIETTQSTEVSTFNSGSTSESYNSTVDLITTKLTAIDTSFEDGTRTTKAEISTSFQEETSFSDNLKSTTESVILTKSTVDSETVKETSEIAGTEITYATSNDNLTDLNRTESVVTSTFTKTDVFEISVTDISSQSPKSEISSRNTFETDITSMQTDAGATQSTKNEELESTTASTLTYESTSKFPGSTKNDPIKRISTTVGTTSETKFSEQTEKSTVSSITPVTTHSSSESFELNVTSDMEITTSNNKISESVTDSESSIATSTTDTTLQTKMIETTTAFEETQNSTTSIPISISTAAFSTTEVVSDFSTTYRTDSSETNDASESSVDPITSSNITTFIDSTSSLGHVTTDDLTSDSSYKSTSTLPTTSDFETSASNFISTVVETSQTESRPPITSDSTTESGIFRTTYEEVIPSKYTMEQRSTETTHESTTENAITNSLSTEVPANNSETTLIISTEFRGTSTETEASKLPFSTTDSDYTSENALTTESSEINTETQTTAYSTDNTKDLSPDYSTTVYSTPETEKETTQTQTLEQGSSTLTTNGVTSEPEAVSKEELISTKLLTSSSASQTEETSTYAHTSKQTSQTVESSSYGITALDTSSDASSINELTSDKSDLFTDVSDSTSTQGKIDTSSTDFSSTDSVSEFTQTSFEKTDSSTVERGSLSFSEVTELTTKYYSTDELISTVTNTDVSEDIFTHISSTTDDSDGETSELSSTHTSTYSQTSTAFPSETTTVLNICLEPNGFYPNPDDCNTFYQCTKGVPKLSWCTVTYHFSPESKVCEDPCSAKCDPKADCPTESDNGSGESTTTLRTTLTENTFSSSQSDFSQTEETSLFTISTKDIQTKITETPEDLISVSGITSGEMVTSDIQTESRISDDLTSVSGFTSGEISSEPDVSPSLYSTQSNSVSERDLTDSTVGITTTYTSDQGTSKSMDLRSLEPITSITNRSTTDVLSESTSHEYLTPSTKDQMTTSDSFSTNVPEQYSSEKTSTSTTEAVTSEITSDIATAQPSSSKTEETSSESEEDISSISTTSNIGSTSTDASIEDTSVPRISTSVRPTKCENNDCISPSTPIPYSVCHRNDFLSRPSCNEYNDCTGRFPVKRQCPFGLHFNPSTRVCDWPYNAGCGEALKPLFEPDDSFQCPCQSCLIPSSTSCSHYYLCLGYTAYHLECSYNLFFDRTQNTCNYKEMVNCLISTSTTRKPTTTSTVKTYSTTIKPERFICPSRNGLFRYPENCGKFYQCSNFHPYEMNCPATTHFSEITKRCEYPCDAKCDLSLNCGINPTSAPRDPRCSCRNCKLPSAETCTKYIVCVNGKARIENCPWGQTFDARKKTCDWAHRVECHHSEMCPEQNGMFPHKDCHKFVHCSNGIPYVKDCPSTLEFDPVKQRCEWPAGRCSHSPVPKEFEVFKKKEYREGWRCPKTFGYFSDDHNCNKFYYCSFGTPSLKECSNGLLYNPRYQTCDWKEHVRCHSNRHTKPRRCRVYDSHAKCSRDRNPLPHTHCNMYYDCTAGRACAKQCPAGLYFNNRTGLCDLPVNVKCSHYPEDYSLKEFSFTCSSHDHGRLSDPSDAACYYHCRQGKVIYGCCSRGQVYNHHKDKCEHKRKSIKI